MRFEERPTPDAQGWTLAHSVEAGERRIAKGTTLDVEDLTILQQHHIGSVHVFCLEPGDVKEDTAAGELANHLAGKNIRVGHTHRGRCNLHSKSDGLLLVNDEINSLNEIDETLTVATLANFNPVLEGQLVATTKVIPYAVTRRLLDQAQQNRAHISVAPFTPFTAHFLLSGSELPDKLRRLTEQRLAKVKGRIDSYQQCTHTVDDVSKALCGLASRPGSLILLLGMSAISDRRDVLPAALEKAGGEVTQLGMPVDPGNLLMLGRLDEKTVLGLPGCARSPALNGLDWVLQRFAARLPLGPRVIRNMGLGGLLKEALQRPEPRAPRHKNNTGVQAVILAAGRSSRAGGTNKLLRTLNGKTVIMETVSVISAATDMPPIVVTGHNQADIEKALSGYTVAITNNPFYTHGMASSLKCGLETLGAEPTFGLICLGDMPFVRSETVSALVNTAAQMSEARIFIPTFNGKRGHPILWHRSLFPDLMAISGDKGGREVIHANESLVCEVPVTDPGILIDLDTPSAMAQFGIKDD
ncbi:molybdopterin-binding/glycosyltransferase family 2 protein [Kordiimonas aestuarii]|uniref:molybdopterin-binding/glycosyltransferase family 2 protein n=1 Tax=Kordiimonas aestuarii TaxID=1005925 RepID=UPI0021CE3A26|nr:molybdopterin-binding/glycosyltransferase family 2 protein [Kordiimonas aestuarii]